MAPEKLPKEALAAVNTYASASSIYSLREGKRLRATLQVIQLSAKTPVRSAAFRRGVISEVSAGIPTLIRLRGRDVYQTYTQGGEMSVWFSGSKLFILFSRKDYELPRGLLQAALAEVR